MNQLSKNFLNVSKIYSDQCAAQDLKLYPVTYYFQSKVRKSKFRKSFKPVSFKSPKSKLKPLLLF